VIPPDANAGFVAAMEDVLETYQKPRDPDRPLVCVDETSKQLIVETRKPIPAKPGRVARHDYQYERNGVANIFMMFAPLEGFGRVFDDGGISRDRRSASAARCAGSGQPRLIGDPLHLIKVVQFKFREIFKKVFMAQGWLGCFWQKLAVLFTAWVNARLGPVETPLWVFPGKRMFFGAADRAHTTSPFGES
jgi:hypothetical protein